MALPVTISGVALDLATVGPFKSSAGNFYFFGKDASVGTTLQCFKATDPTVSWSSIATKTGYATKLLDIAAFQVADVIHLAISDGSYAGLNYKYATFNMATDAFVLGETIASSVAASDDGPPLCSIVVRTTGQPVVLVQGPLHGSSDSSVHYSIRTGVNTWAALVEVDDAVDNYNYANPVAILGDADTVQFVYYSTGTAARTYQRALSSSNVLQTSTYVSGANYVSDGIAFGFNGNTRCIAAPTYGYTIYFDAGDTPTLHASSNSWIAYVNESSLRLFEQNGIAYLLYSVTAGGNKDYYFRSSSDGGATWSAAQFICHSSNSGLFPNTSRFAKLFPSVDDIILPFLYADDGATSLKHNQKVVASTSVNLSFPASGTAAGVAGSVAKALQKAPTSAVGTAVSVALTSNPVIAIGAASAASANASVVAQGGSVTVNLESVTANTNSPVFSIEKEQAGVAGSGQVTRLGPGGYPIAALPGAAGAAETSIGLFSATASAAIAGISNFDLGFVLDDASSVAAIASTPASIGKPVSGTTTTARSAAISRLQSVAFEAMNATPVAATMEPSVAFWLFDSTAYAFAKTDIFGISIGKDVQLEATIAAAFANEVLPFIGSFVALESIFATGIGANATPQNAIILPAALSTGATNEVHFEGDETFSLEAAAAAGIVGNLTCAIIIPSAVVICNMNAAMTANNLGAALNANDLNGAIGIGNLVAAMATGALRTETQTGSMQTSIRCH